MVLSKWQAWPHKQPSIRRGAKGASPAGGRWQVPAHCHLLGDAACWRGSPSRGNHGPRAAEAQRCILRWGAAPPAQAVQSSQRGRCWRSGSKGQPAAAAAAARLQPCSSWKGLILREASLHWPLVSKGLFCCWKHLCLCSLGAALAAVLCKRNSCRSHGYRPGLRGKHPPGPSRRGFGGALQAVLGGSVFAAGPGRAGLEPSSCPWHGGAVSCAQEAQLCLGTQHGFVGKGLGWNRLARRAQWARQAPAPQSGLSFSEVSLNFG